MLAQSPEPEAHDKVLDNSRSNWNLEMLDFEERGKPEDPKKNLSEQGREPTTNVNPHMTPSPRIQSGTHWWEARALTTAPSLLPSGVMRQFILCQPGRLLCWFSSTWVPFCLYTISGINSYHWTLAREESVMFNIFVCRNITHISIHKKISACWLAERMPSQTLQKVQKVVLECRKLKFNCMNISNKLSHDCSRKIWKVSTRKFLKDYKWHSPLPALAFFLNQKAI